MISHILSTLLLSNKYKKLCLLTLLSLAPFTGLTAALPADKQVNTLSVIESELVDKISQAKNRLSKVEQSVTKQRVALANKINKLEREVIALRNETAIATRLADEKTLSITQLEERLSTWHQQNIYQKNLLHRYLQNNAKNHTNNNQVSQANSATFNANTGVSNQLARVLEYNKHINQQFYPQWQSNKVIMPNGEMVTNPTLTLGPVTWYWDENSEQAGLVGNDQNAVFQHKVYLQNSDSMAMLRSTLKGDIVFDPTLGQAITREQQSESVVDHVIKGGVWAIPILLFALFAIIIALLKVVQLARLPKFVHLSPSVLVSIVRNKSVNSENEENISPDSPNALNALNAIKGMQKALLDITTNHSLSSQRDDLLFIKLQECKQTLDKRISAIAITAAISPLLGLLGTVSGMIETFKMMTLFGSGDPEVVSGGIAQALVTTELGLVVAIPALILNAVLSRKAKAYYADLENFAILVSKSDEQKKENSHD
ncbi:MotA/TolQ/ExbB proton channel family protein [Colwellia echini]|uniref:MotA/TolQ/ExbB proton channel family protein n=1 Tax=Colwellia echini TaxID=1982103 RepID=A0ABY3MUV8_9GAMM|nr:MotA/TolQ/ExbB proton channel family protein [Colwellia echini]TYK64983.1 MotA/TolQ/ExbB proton channel family protein [Colwellia echini]